MVTQEKDTLDRIRELNEKEKKKFFKKIDSRKKVNQTVEFKPDFKPCSPHEYKD
jgi:hypothetical protein